MRHLDSSPAHVQDKHIPKINALAVTVSKELFDTPVM